MSYPFVASAVQAGTARGPRLALVVHMAEGGGTVGYLSRPNPNSVSVHFVVERTGRIVQMLRLDQMHTSIRASDIRTTNDADGFFGKTARQAVMGAWGTIATTLGPNHASIACEVEGYALAGPTTVQMNALATLYADLVTKYPGIRSLGHRDFADYKACPGRKIDWTRIGGHGPATEEPVGTTTITVLPFGGTYVIPANATPRGFKLTATGLGETKTWPPKPTPSSASYDATMTTTLVSGNPFIRCTNGFFEGFYLPASQVVETPNPAPVPVVPDDGVTQAMLDAAVKAQKDADAADLARAVTVATAAGVAKEKSRLRTLLGL